MVYGGLTAGLEHAATGNTGHLVLASHFVNHDAKAAGFELPEALVPLLVKLCDLAVAIERDKIKRAGVSDA